jgi:hypothetical protein
MTSPLPLVWEIKQIRKREGNLPRLRSHRSSSAEVGVVTEKALAIPRALLATILYVLLLGSFEI